MEETQVDMFHAPERVTKFQAHSDTSRSAAREIEQKAKTLRGKIYRFLQKRGHFGATDEELQTLCQMNPSTQRPRRIELVERGLVKDSGERRKTASNRDAVVWIVP